MIEQFFLALSFLTRVPVGKRDFAGMRLAQSVWAFPLVGALVGAIAGGVFFASTAAGLSVFAAAWLAMGASILLTGGLHEDGLADSADGLASGRNAEQKLAIMRDSRIGAYGVLALVCVLALRACGMMNIQTVSVFIAAAAASRAGMVALMAYAPNARNDGLGAHAGKPEKNQLLMALAIAAVSLFFAGHVGGVVAGGALLAAIVFLVGYVAKKNIGGITGDVLGACQLLSEVALLLLFETLR